MKNDPPAYAYDAVGHWRAGKEKFKKEFRDTIYQLTLGLIEFVDKLPETPSARIIGGQLLRNGTSAGTNYIEAQAASSKKDFTSFLHHSLKSASASKFWLFF